MKEFLYFILPLIAITAVFAPIVFKYKWSQKIWKMDSGKKIGAFHIIIWLAIAVTLQMSFSQLILQLTGDASVSKMGQGIGLGLMIPFIPTIKANRK